MADFISGLLFVLVSGWVFAQSLELPQGRGTVPGPGFFPELAATFGVIVGAAICLRAVVAWRRRAAGGAKPASRGETPTDLLRLVGLLVLGVAYVAAFKTLGFVLASILFLALALLVLGERRVLVLALLPAGLTGTVAFVFTTLLGLRLPPGTLF